MSTPCARLPDRQSDRPAGGRAMQLVDATAGLVRAAIPTVAHGAHHDQRQRLLDHDDLGAAGIGGQLEVLMARILVCVGCLHQCLQRVRV